MLTVVLLSGQSVAWKITDFGLTSEGTSGRTYTTCFSPGAKGYRAPELMEELTENSNGNRLVQNPARPASRCIGRAHRSVGQCFISTRGPSRSLIGRSWMSLDRVPSKALSGRSDRSSHLKNPTHVGRSQVMR